MIGIFVGLYLTGALWVYILHERSMKNYWLEGQNSKSTALEKILFVVMLTLYWPMALADIVYTNEFKSFR